MGGSMAIGPGGGRRWSYAPVGDELAPNASAIISQRVKGGLLNFFGIRREVRYPRFPSSHGKGQASRTTIGEAGIRGSVIR
jgi:hypothetical protein